MAQQHLEMSGKNFQCSLTHYSLNVQTFCRMDHSCPCCNGTLGNQQETRGLATCRANVLRVYHYSSIMEDCEGSWLAGLARSPFCGTHPAPIVVATSVGTMVSSDDLEMQILCEDAYTMQQITKMHNWILAHDAVVHRLWPTNEDTHGHHEEWQTLSSCPSHIQWYHPNALLQLEDESLAICLDQEESWPKWSSVHMACLGS